jgi:hypothetical protein
MTTTNRRAGTTTNDEPPVCVYCKQGTTPRRLVHVWGSLDGRRRYHAHVGCANRERREAVWKAKVPVAPKPAEPADE